MAPWARYVLGIFLAGAAAAARMAMLPLNGGFTFLTFYPAIVISALLFGTRPALLTLALSAGIAEYVFMPPFW